MTLLALRMYAMHCMLCMRYINTELNIVSKKEKKLFVPNKLGFVHFK